MNQYKPNKSSSNSLSSLQSRKRSWFLLTAFVGQLLFVPLYWSGVLMHSLGWVTPLFTQTVLWCLLPYAFVVRLQYKSIHFPAAELRLLLPLNVVMPFLILVLGFALLQMSYARSAVLLTSLVVLLWFWLANRWARPSFKLELLVIQPEAQAELMAQLGDSAKQHSKHLQFVAWPQQGAAEPPLCDGVLLSTTVPLTVDQLHQLAMYKQMHVRIYSAAAVSEQLTGCIGSTVLQNPFWQPDGNPAYDIAKRFFDLLAVVATAPVWLALGAVVALAIKLDSAGPAVLGQWRTGQHGQMFKIYKFRTMAVHGESTAKFAQVNDKRITRIGFFLRKSRLDEIPQFVNVLLGHMSLIGPRPEQHTFVNDFSVSIPSYPYRHLVRPGITGWAQVMQGYAASEEETIIKLSYDLYYVKHYSLALDFLIVLKTLRTLLTGFGAR
jgi:lipopolysaccharide/colanic/teichoic acid biosynthesis glycosyltransferase